MSQEVKKVSSPTTRASDQSACDFASQICTPQDSGNCPIIGMESVVATVSGYHGIERFEVIKLIERCGAYYVSGLNRSITHLVCWQFEGKKFDLAQKLKTHVINHCWFADCLKQGRRLPEGPYTMQSGEEVGPVLPSLLNNDLKIRISHFGKWNTESNHYKTPHSGKGKAIDLELLNWSDSLLLKEDSLHGWDAKKRSCSQTSRKSKRVLGRNHHHNKHQSAIIDDTGSWPELSSGLSTRLRRRRNCHDDAYDKVYTWSTDGIQIREHTDDDNPRSRTSSSSLEIVPESVFYENKKSRRMRDEEEDMKEQSECPNSIDSDFFERFSILTAEANPKVANSIKIKTSTDLCESEEDQDKRKKCGAPSELSTADKQRDLSCVICWTEFCSSRGVLPCGHRFCYSCIQEWADCMASRGKMSTCPLCKANFASITKFEDPVSSDQKIFSQTIPCSSSKLSIFCRPDVNYDASGATYSESVCFECRNREPEDLLLSCHVCRSRWAHSCCLDPPLIPWTCIHCRDIRMLYQRFR